MCSIRPILHKIVTGEAVVRVLGAIFLFIIMNPQWAFASSIMPMIGSKQPSKSFHVQWHSPKFVKFIDKQHGRFEIDGKAAPGVKIQIEPQADWIDSQDKAGSLTIQDMSPRAEQNYRVLVPKTHVA